MADPINLAIKDGLNAFFEGQPLAPYTKPLAGTAEDMVARGLLDENGEATDQGELFVALQDAGAIDPEGKLTEKGHAYAMPVEDTFKPENRWAFKLRTETGLDDNDADFDQMAGAVGDFLWDAGAGAIKRVGIERDLLQGMTPGQTKDPKTQARLDASNTGIVEGAANAMQELLGMGEVGAGLVGIGLGKVIGMDEEAEGTLWGARQEFARIRYENQTRKAGERAEKLGLVGDAVNKLEQAKETLGEEEYAKLSKQSNAFGQMLDPTMLLPAGEAAKAGRAASLVTRAEIKADRVLAKVATLDEAVAGKAVELAAAKRAASTAGNASDLAAKMAEDFTSKFENTGEALFQQRAARASEIAQRTAFESGDAAKAIPTIESELAQMTDLRNSLVTKIPENIAQRAKSMVEVGRNFKGKLVSVPGGIVGQIGAKIDDVDTALGDWAKRKGWDKVYTAGMTGSALAGLSGNPIIGAPAAIAAGLKGGKVLESVGKFSRIVGDEMAKARGQVPFWQRVANHAELSPAHRATAHLFDTFNWGGAVPGAIRRTGRGVLASYPANLTFEYLADGGNGNANTFKRALAESLVIGGSSAALGGAFLGTKGRHKQLALADEVSFRSDITDARQRSAFDALPPEMRRSVATYAASNPNLDIRFSDSGPSHYDSHSGTVTINTKSSNPLKPLTAHEVLHHVAIRNQQEEGIGAMLIGDGETGGLLRSNDGKLDPDFQEFVDSYNARMVDEGLPPIPLQRAAIEYFVDSSADYVAGIAESGDLGAMAGKPQLKRVIDRVVEAVIPRVPIIRDIHFKMGGQMDQQGRMVMGNGLLAGGIRELPQVRKMTQKMLRESAGRSQSAFTPTGSKAKSDGGIPITVTKGDKAVIDKMISIFETEEVNGQTRVKYDKNGDPIPLNRATDMARSKAGLIIGEELATQKANGKQPKKGEIHMAEPGKYEGTYLGDDALRKLDSANILNKEQMRMLRNVNQAAKNYTGGRFMVINHPATKKVGKKVRYATLAPTLRDVAPAAISITKDGNILVHLMSVTQLHENIQTRAASKRGQSLYHGDTEAIMNDVAKVMELHRAGERTDSYFDSAYGIVEGPKRKDFINTIFGLMTPEQRQKNPLFDTDAIPEKSNVYKTYRLDRISQATRLSPDTHVPMPFMYDAAKLNLMPNGAPRE